MTSLKNVSFSASLHDTVSDDGSHIDVNVGFISNDNIYSSPEELKSVGIVIDNDAFINASLAEHRELAHKMLDAYLDACEKEREITY